MNKPRTILTVLVGAACAQVLLLGGSAGAKEARLGDLPWTVAPASVSAQAHVSADADAAPSAAQAFGDLPWT
ncbi:hypothetical protein GCM10018785_52520 [Streptomyces longispororuber]|uniref:Uncharacterized protein n=1 Tax=Streptomyces longispororuber TaxID=68230 RepID=A0A918ZYK9_9ACTN|nr:hypothetical protein [Streptomyces longispororuber]GHE77754.1 hypothetical protein GCM10018785_52520 [Streptomyces longispororuber]